MFACVNVCGTERREGGKGRGVKKKKRLAQSTRPTSEAFDPSQEGPALPARARTNLHKRTHARIITHSETHTHTHAHPSTRTSPSRARACFGQGGTCLATSGCDRAVTRRMEPMKQTIYMTPWRICQQEEWRGGRPAKGTSTQQCSRMRERERDAIARDLRAALTAYSSKASNRIDRAC